MPSRAWTPKPTATTRCTPVGCASTPMRHSAAWNIRSTTASRSKRPLRYNIDRRTFDNCGISATDHLVRFWNTFRGGGQPPTRLGRCFVMDPANGLRPVDNVHALLDENNVAWRLGIDWSPRAGVLVYANVSQGYKAGTVPVLGATTADQFKPVPQESLLAYETGFKAALFDHRAQLNAAALLPRLPGQAAARPLSGPDVRTPRSARIDSRIPRDRAGSGSSRCCRSQGLTVDAFHDAHEDPRRPVHEGMTRSLDTVISRARSFRSRRDGSR